METAAWPDIEALLTIRGDSLDQAYIEDWLDQFAEALQKPELLSEYRKLMRKSHRNR